MRAVLILAAAALILAGCGGRKKPVKAVARPVGWHETGVASWYGDPYHGRHAANGEIFDMEKLTAAHRTLAFNTWLRVHNLDNGRSVVVRITDRGPFVGGRILDLSRAAAREIDMIGPGLAKVRIEVIRPPEHPPEPLVVAAPAPKPLVIVAGAPRMSAPGAPDSSSAGNPSAGNAPGAGNPAVVGAPAASNPAAGTTPASDGNPSAANPPPAALELYAVQVGVFSDRANAARVRAQMEQNYGSARMVAREGRRIQWRVLAGREETEEGAAALAERIRAGFGFKDAFVVRLDESPEKPAQDPQPLRP
jgi:rare lipoprotein A (peptidoglycan hydrolase)